MHVVGAHSLYALPNFLLTYPYCLCCIGRPFKYLLRPIHSHETMHLPEVNHLPLSCVPQLVVRLGVLKLGLSVQVLPYICLMLVKGLAGPPSGAVDAIVRVWSIWYKCATEGALVLGS